jgi:hypothetical protein
MTPEHQLGKQPLLCNRCRIELWPGSGDFYVVKIEAVADPTPPTVSAGEMARDVRREIEELLARMEELSSQEAMDQVYRRVIIHLCGPCYRRWIEDPSG